MTSAFFKFIGDPRELKNKDGSKERHHGPDRITISGATFVKGGEPTEVTDPSAIKKLRGNGHFVEVFKAQPAEPVIDVEAVALSKVDAEAKAAADRAAALAAENAATEAAAAAARTAAEEKAAQEHQEREQQAAIEAANAAAALAASQNSEQA